MSAYLLGLVIVVLVGILVVASGLRLLARLAQVILGPRVVILSDDESAVVIADDGRPTSLVLAGDSEDLSLGCSIAGCVFVAAAEEPGRLLTALDGLESVQSMRGHSEVD